MEASFNSKMSLRSRFGRKATAGFAGSLLALALIVGNAAAESHSIKFDMVRSKGIQDSGCLADAKAKVKIKSLGPVEVMTVEASGLPPKTEFDLFVTQLPAAPFGVSWYQGDLETDRKGKAKQEYIGRFNIETFAIAPGVGPAPVVHNSDASSNPAFGPIHTFHLGLWFNSPEDAARAGCPAGTTPFNGEHNAGVQVFNTSNFANDKGPLRQLEP